MRLLEDGEKHIMADTVRKRGRRGRRGGWRRTLKNIKGTPSEIKAIEEGKKAAAKAIKAGKNKKEADKIRKDTTEKRMSSNRMKTLKEAGLAAVQIAPVGRAVGLATTAVKGLRGAKTTADVVRKGMDQVQKVKKGTDKAFKKQKQLQKIEEANRKKRVKEAADLRKANKAKKQSQSRQKRIEEARKRRDAEVAARNKKLAQQKKAPVKKKVVKKAPVKKTDAKKKPVEMSAAARKKAEQRTKGYKQKEPKNKYSTAANARIARNATKRKPKKKTGTSVVPVKSPPKVPAKRTGTSLVPVGRGGVRSGSKNVGRSKLGTLGRGLGTTAALVGAKNIYDATQSKPKKVVAPRPPRKPKPDNKIDWTVDDEDRIVEKGKTITSNPKGDGSRTGLDLKTILSRIEDREYMSDPDDPSLHDLDDLKADLKELRGYRRGGPVRRSRTTNQFRGWGKARKPKHKMR